MQFNHLILGGLACVTAVTVGALSSSVVDEQFERGRALFSHAFSVEEGVGAPEMNADSCRACHQDPSLGGAGPLEVNVSRMGRDNGGLGPFQSPTEGQGLSKLYPPTVHGREEYEPFGLNAPDVFEQRQTPRIIGEIERLIAKKSPGSSGAAWSAPVNYAGSLSSQRFREREALSFRFCASTTRRLRCSTSGLGLGYLTGTAFEFTSCTGSARWHRFRGHFRWCRRPDHR